MLRTIDRYMLRQFVQIFLICYISIYGLYVVIDAFGHLDHFIDHSKQGTNLIQVVGKYYAYRSLAFFDRMSGMLALIAAMFTVTWIQRHNEMTALMAAGITRLRVLRPVLIASLAISLVALGSREWLVPGVRHELAVDSKHLDNQSTIEIQSLYDSQTDILLGGESAQVHSQTIVRPNFVLPAELSEFGKQLSAAEAQFIPAQGDHPSGYLLHGVTSPELLLTQPSLLLDGKVIIATPANLAWLKPDEVFVTSGVSFELLVGGSTWRDYASTRELVRELASPSTDLGSDIRVAVHTRLLQPFFDATLLLLGLPLVISRGNRSPFLAIGLCLLVVTAFFLVMLGSQSLGASGWIRPVLAAWMPLIIFVPLAAGMSFSLQQ